MDVKEAITRRRSVRKYEDKEIPEEIINELLGAAQLAPSGCNAQPWRFTIINSKTTKKILRDKRAFKQNFVYKAPLILVCCGDPKAYNGKYGGEYQIKEGSVPKDTKDRKKMFSMVEGKENIRAIRDLSIASAFVVLRAIELNIGTCYVGLIDEEVLKETLKIPEDFIIPFVITAGYFNAQAIPRQTKELKEIIISDNM